MPDEIKSHFTFNDLLALSKMFRGNDSDHFRANNPICNTYLIPCYSTRKIPNHVFGFTNLSLKLNNREILEEVEYHEVLEEVEYHEALGVLDHHEALECWTLRSFESADHASDLEIWGHLEENLKYKSIKIVFKNRNSKWLLCIRRPKTRTGTVDPGV
ncbi:18272_t:CDS:2 [Dentiscutata erythropus]|uniref:18272_t:CDS:1 n=1 Tax=Dentiscutata erythropus TaxID=1348616 RepID=A0A9N8ZEX2_9GLOM|nr:18272_t:CDS:2 [Dentiscutata erythropus]